MLLGGYVKRILTAAITAIFALASFAVPASAEAGDAFNAEATPSPEKTATFLIGEDDGSIENYSMLTASGKTLPDGSTSQWTCESVNDPACAKGKAVSMGSQAILPVCDGLRTSNCVVGLELTNTQGKFEPATFVRNISGMTFAPNTNLNFYGATTPAIFEAKHAPSASGTTQYAVTVRTRLDLDWKTGKFRVSGTFASVTPFREQQDPGAEAPYQFTTEANHRGQRGIAVGGHGYACVFTEDGLCGVQQDFAEGVRVRLTVRLSNQIGGWFKGRIKNPTISVTKAAGQNNTVVVEAQPATVTKMVYQQEIAKLTPRQKNLVGGMAGTWDNGFTTWTQASRTEAFAYLETFRNAMADTARGSNTYWNFSTVGNNQGNGCLSDTSRVLGIVTTNSMIYDGGVPKFSGGFLNYKVAGLHYMPDGKTLVEGTYDLVMRSDVARCLYKFSNAPLSATVSVTGGTNKNVATTVVSEKNGWLKLAAYGFTFSQKTIKVKIVKKKK